ncbi:hypothetical protein KZ483_09965 [Paenibacillus sp. sptzw28]|uniref:hypothetical protein n=1 Tax=Paenibacillus sp. sptzw28 TaxID=715179 RepID=UPI001C6ED649|nr:hypothetical protein [Paenibacillus sp. sptzw28]QYR23208.1 hypothetical protein KZ483_09965 [Paenibacillus sp. sptzw28]
MNNRNREAPEVETPEEKTSSAAQTRSPKQRAWILAMIIVLIIVLFGAIFVIMINTLRSDGVRTGIIHAAKQYEYKTKTASNGFELHVLKSKPSNITLELVRRNVTQTGYYGINGGFFSGESLLSIATVNGFPVAGPKGQYGVGDENVKYPRGTLLWDGALDKLSVQIVSRSAELKVKDPNRFWAQGGISMSIGRDDAWELQAKLENAPFSDDKRLRSALVYDNKGMLYLVVSATKGTLAEFRAALLETVGDGQLADGIFVDGDGSSQLQAAEASLPGDNRPVVQMIRIVK